MNEEVIIEKSTDNLINKTFFWMFLGLLGTAGIAWYTYASGLWVNILENNYFNALLFGEAVVVILFSISFKKFSPITVAILYFLYSMLNGVTLSIIFLVFELDSIVLLFLTSAGLFGLFAFLGFITKKDLGKWYYLLFGTLLASLIVSIVNMFLGNSTLDILLDCIILFVFFGITAYDMQKIKALQYDDSIGSDKLYIYGAMELYLDYINIFLRILSLLGKRKN